MEKLNGLEGVFSPLLVPFTNNGTINYTETTRLAKYISDNGVNGVLVGGSTGEFVNLSIDERKNLLTAVMKGVGKHCSVIFNCTALNKEDAENYITWGKFCGVDGFTSTTPFYHSYDDEALFGYFQQMAELCGDTPYYLYNIPSRTQNTISSSLTKRLLETTDNIKGIKDSSMDFMTFQEYQLLAKDYKFQVSTGNDMQLLPALKAGGVGGVLALATCFPRAAADMYKCFQNGEIQKAEEIQEKFFLICKVIRGILPIMSHKKILDFAGFNLGKARVPMRNLTDGETDQLKEAVEKLGF